MNITLILISLAYAASRFADIWTSQRGIYYGTLEANALYADKYKQFSLWKNLIASGVLYGICLAFALNIDYLWTLFLPFTLGSLYIGYANWRLQKANRVKQTAFLEHLRDIQPTDQPHIEEAFNGQLITSINGRAWYTLFGWIYEAGESADMLVRQRLITRIAALALQPNWFPK